MITEKKFQKFFKTLEQPIIEACEWPIDKDTSFELEWKLMRSYDGFFMFATAAYRLNYTHTLYDFLTGRLVPVNKELKKKLQKFADEQARENQDYLLKQGLLYGTEEFDEEYDALFEEVEIGYKIKLSFFEGGNQLGCETAEDRELVGNKGYVKFTYDVSILDQSFISETLLLTELDGEKILNLVEKYAK